jgi:hypothetical protein
MVNPRSLVRKEPGARTRCGDGARRLSRVAGMRRRRGGNGRRGPDVHRRGDPRPDVRVRRPAHDGDPERDRPPLRRPRAVPADPRGPRRERLRPGRGGVPRAAAVRLHRRQPHRRMVRPARRARPPVRLARDRVQGSRVRHVRGRARDGRDLPPPMPRRLPRDDALAGPSPRDRRRHRDRGGRQGLAGTHLDDRVAQAARLPADVQALPEQRAPRDRAARHAQRHRADVRLPGPGRARRTRARRPAVRASARGLWAPRTPRSTPHSACMQRATRRST